MKKTFLPLILTCLIAANASAQEEKLLLQSKSDTIGWIMGESYAKTFLKSGLPVSKKKAIEAFVNTLNDNPSPFDENTYQSILDYVNFSIFTRNRQLAKQQAEEATRLEQNYFQELTANNPAVHRAPSGFYYEVLKEGEGAQAKENHRITFDYKGFYMLSGEAFDQTYGQGEPLTINLSDNTFTGLQQGLLMMKEGSIYRFYFPFQLAFGSRGSQIVPPFTPLIYEVELHKVHED